MSSRVQVHDGYVTLTRCVPPEIRPRDLNKTAGEKSISWLAPGVWAWRAHDEVDLSGEDVMQCDAGTRGRGLELELAVRSSPESS